MKRWRRLLRHRRAQVTAILADLCNLLTFNRAGDSLNRRSAHITIFEGE